MNKTKNNYSTNTKKHRTSLYRRPWLWILVILIVVGVISIVVISSNKTSSEDQPNVSQNEQTETASVDDGDTPRAESEYTNNEDAPEPKITQYEGENPNQSDVLTGSVSSKDIADGFLTIMVNVDQYLNGTCSLEMRGQHTSDTYDMTSRLSADVSTSYCNTFKIPLSALMNDYYDIKITISGNGKTGIITDGVQL